MEAITGRRQFFFGELRRLVVAENIVAAFRSRAKSKNWADWARENPGLVELLIDAETLANG